MEEEKIFREVQPCGMLYSLGKAYFLLHPEPIIRDSWQGDGAYRWVVVPKQKIGWAVDADYAREQYPHARHIVSTAFTVEYSPMMPKILVHQLPDEYGPDWEKLQFTFMEN